jgi:hypothetical protein
MPFLQVSSAGLLASQEKEEFNINSFRYFDQKDKKTITRSRKLFKELEKSRFSMVSNKKSLQSLPKDHALLASPLHDSSFQSPPGGEEKKPKVGNATRNSRMHMLNSPSKTKPSLFLKALSLAFFKKKADSKNKHHGASLETQRSEGLPAPKGLIPPARAGSVKPCLGGVTSLGSGTYGTKPQRDEQSSPKSWLQASQVPLTQKLAKITTGRGSQPFGLCWEGLKEPVQGPTPAGGMKLGVSPRSVPGLQDEGLLRVGGTPKDSPGLGGLAQSATPTLGNKPNSKPTLNLRPMSPKQRLYCPDCDVEYTWSVIRRYQLGYISLIAPVAHVWYIKTRPNILAILLGMKAAQLENVVYCTKTFTLENTFFQQKNNIFSFFKTYKSRLISSYPVLNLVSPLAPGENQPLVISGGAPEALQKSTLKTRAADLYKGEEPSLFMTGASSSPEGPPLRSTLFSDPTAVFRALWLPEGLGGSSQTPAGLHTSQSELGKALWPLLGGFGSGQGLGKVKGDLKECPKPTLTQTWPEGPRAYSPLPPAFAQGRRKGLGSPGGRGEKRRAGIPDPPITHVSPKTGNM